MKIIPEKTADYIYIQMLQKISKVTKNSVEDTLKTAISCLHKEWKDKGLI